MDGKNAVVFLRFNIYIQYNLVNASELPIFLPPIMHKRYKHNKRCKMKYQIIFISLMLLLFSCEKDMNPISLKDEILDLTPGNKFRFFKKNNLQEYHFIREVIKDTTINNNKWKNYDISSIDL